MTPQNLIMPKNNTEQKYLKNSENDLWVAVKSRLRSCWTVLRYIYFKLCYVIPEDRMVVKHSSYQ